MSKKSLKIQTALIASAALAAIHGNDSNSIKNNDSYKNSDNEIVLGRNVKKPMPVLKLNLSNFEDSKFVASHISHGSHRSHSSHRSHYSHRSGALFS